MGLFLPVTSMAGLAPSTRLPFTWVPFLWCSHYLAAHIFIRSTILRSIPPLSSFLHPQRRCKFPSGDALAPDAAHYLLQQPDVVRVGRTLEPGQIAATPLAFSVLAVAPLLPAKFSYLLSRFLFLEFHPAALALPIYVCASCSFRSCLDCAMNTRAP